MQSRSMDMPLDTPLAIRLISLFLRPVIIVVSSTLAVYSLLSLRDLPGSGGQGSTGGVGGYVPWLRGALGLDLSPQVSDRLVSSLQLLAAGLFLGLALALVFGSFLRSTSLRGPIALAGMMASSLHPIVVGSTLLYWLAVEFRLLPPFGASSFSDDPVDALKRLVLPATVVAVAIAPSVSSMIARVGREDAPTGFASMMAAAADRSVSRFGWSVGFPFGTVLVALVVAETLFARPGVAGLAFEGLRLLDFRLILDATFVIALIAALVGFGIDLVSLRPLVQPAHPVAPQPRLFGPVLAASVAALCLLGLLAVGFLADGETSLASVADANRDPLSPGHLLGTDQLGRDVFALFVGGLPRLLGGALLAGSVAVLGGALVAAIWNLLGRGGAILGLLIDVAWWPGALVLLAGFVVSSSWIWSLVLISVLLVPLAMRLAAREIRWTMRSGLWQLLGLVGLVAAVAFSLLLLSEFLGLGSGGGATIGGLLRGDLIREPMRTAALGIAATLLAFLLNLLGSSLVRIGWICVPRPAVAQPEASAVMADPLPDPTMAMAAEESPWTSQPISVGAPMVSGPPGLPPVPVTETIGPDDVVWAPPTGAQQRMPPPEVPRPDLEATRIGSVPDIAPRLPTAAIPPLVDQDPTDPGAAPPAPVVPRPHDSQA